MTPDKQYQDYNYSLPELNHLYGDNVHIIKDPYLITILERICRPQTEQPLLNEYVKKAYTHLFSHIVSNSFPRKVIQSNTRMHEDHKEGKYDGEILDQTQKVVTVDLARAGMVPSQLIYEELNYLLTPSNIRQDHFYAARKVNEKNEVIGVDISGSKIGGDVDDSIVIFPDPMGATGGTICEAISHYKNSVDGKAKKYISAHLIITPEYIQKIKKHHPDCEVYTIRLDRGLSSKDALNSTPGEKIQEEKGLNQNQYIIPGAGGVGELLNNSFV
jgi:uracil phosphoribosyltransferase